MNGPWSDDELARLDELWEQDVFVKQIAYQMGRSEHSIRSKVAARKLKARHRWEGGGVMFRMYIPRILFDKITEHVNGRNKSAFVRDCITAHLSKSDQTQSSDQA